MLKYLYSVVLLLAITASISHAESYIRDYTYNASEADSKITSRINALDQLKTILLQEIGTHIRSEINITKDGRGNTYASEDVEAITAGLTKVEILEEKWNGESYYLKAKIEADTDKVLMLLEEIKREKTEENMLRLEKLKDNQRKLSLARNEVARLRNKLDHITNTTEQEKEIIIDEYIKQVDQISLYDMYESGHNYNKRGQLEDAVYWYLKAAEQGSPDAQNSLGDMYFKGRGVKQDLEEAKRWYTKAANQGSIDAYNNLGNVYRRNHKKISLIKAEYWYKKAADQGHADAQFNLGYMYAIGIGIDKDGKEAAKLYKKSAEQGHAIAQNSLGYMHYKGNGVEQDYALAIHWYKKSAKQGNKFAQLQLADMYNTGKGVNQNYEQAAYWYKQAADKNDPVAQNKLGFMYFTGQGVKRDYAKAIHMYTKAAKQGNMDAQYNLGYMYKKGRGVDQDESTAKKWYRKACDSGYKVACSNI